jgi:hypothetical protein
MTYSDEYRGPARLRAPLMSDGCPRCSFDGAVAPYATEPAHRKGTTAFYRHRLCGFQWTTNWLVEPHLTATKEHR